MGQEAERCHQPGKFRWVEIWKWFANSGRDRRKENRRIVDRRPTMGSAELGGEVVDIEVRLGELVVKRVGPLEVDERYHHADAESRGDRVLAPQSHVRPPPAWPRCLRPACEAGRCRCPR